MKPMSSERALPSILLATVLLVASSCGNDPLANWSAEAAAFEDEVLALVNQRRAEGAICGGETREPTHPLTMNRLLRDAARLHSHDMAERNYFSHTSPDGDGPSERIDATGYDGRTWGENIARGQRSPEAVMDAWMNSAGHCRNIMNSSFEEIGIGFYENDSSRYWTQKFSRPR